ncbi:MAG: hypothetical protein B7733_10540 [Myxococcales bacterium FL481]|nr:MAG: hypothetical protein B7733_10540 [Myxococcales bacterium FL481]
MAIAVVAANVPACTRMERLGVTDSKRFGASAKAKAKRAELAHEIRSTVSQYAVRLVDVRTIDEHTFRGQLNQLERDVVADMLAALETRPRSRIVCDGQKIFAPLRRQFPALEAVNDGESVHITVAAASILAKHARDEAFAAIAAKYELEFGPIRGGGYLNAATRAFLDEYAARRGGELPPEARRSWGADKQRASSP